MLIGVPVDSVGREGGTEHGPRALRELGLAEAVGASDHGDLDLRIQGDERDAETGLLASDDVLAATRAIRSAVAEVIADGARPILAGGCCSELPGALAGARDALGGVGLAYVDGHLDLYDGETSPTGEAADMPISVVLGRGPRAWVEAAGGPGAEAARISIAGYRDGEESLRHGMTQPEDLDPRPHHLAVDAVRKAGPGQAGGEIAERLGTRGRFWLHFDVDVLDQEVFPATDYLMPGGLGWDETEALLAPLLCSEMLAGASVACYNPDRDPGRGCGRALVAALSPLARASA